MATNPETIVTDYFKRRVTALGGYYFKLSDRFTRGVPDCHVTFDRGVFVEMKEGLWLGPVATYQKLTIRGAQDHKIRQMCRRARKSACVISAPMRSPENMTLWVPVAAHREGRRDFNQYRIAAQGEEQVMKWLGHRKSLI